jgi:hypothetical protein
MSEEEKMIKFCDVTSVNETMNEAYKYSKTIPFNPNSYIYLNDVYSSFNEKITSDPNFLKYVECELSNKLFKEILTRSNKYDINHHITIQNIQPNYILLIQCPSIFAPYHFITAVINEERTSVSIFQSFGSSMRLHKIEMDYNKFETYLLSLNTYKNEGREFIDDYNMLIPIESNLYGINVPDYIATNEAQYTKEDNMYDELDEDENIIIQNSQKIGLSPRYYEELEYIHSINKYRLNITAYRVKPPNGGKRKRKTRKTVNLRKKSKIRKRTRRYKHLK